MKPLQGNDVHRDPSTAQAAFLIGVGPAKIRILVAHGELRAYSVALKPGGRS